MPEKETLDRAQRDKREGKAPSTQAGEFVREEMDHIRAGKHGARSTKQAIAIGLSKARRAGVDLPAPKAGSSEKVKAQAKRDSAKGRSGSQATNQTKPSTKRSRATLGALRREGHEAASAESLARQARSSARHRTASDRSAAAQKAVRTKGREGLKAAGKKAARTRARHA
jgi:hypothetical protein